MLEIPGRTRHAVHEVLGNRGVAELRSVGFADHDRAGGAQAFDLRAIAAGNLLAKRQRTVGGDQTLGILQVLDPQRHAFQGPRRTARNALFGGARVAQQRIAIAQRDDGIQVAVGLVDARQDRLHQFNGRRGACPQSFRQFKQRQPEQFVHGRYPPILMCLFLTRGALEQKPKTRNRKLIVSVATISDTVARADDSDQGSVACGHQSTSHADTSRWRSS